MITRPKRRERIKKGASLTIVKELIVETCEGCDLPGTIDWCGHWLCEACLAIERTELEPALERANAQALSIEESLSWPASKRGSTFGWTLESVTLNMNRLKMLDTVDWMRRN